MNDVQTAWWRELRTPGTGSGPGRFSKGATITSLDQINEGDLIYCDGGGQPPTINIARALRRGDPSDLWYCIFVDPRDTTSKRLPSDFEWVIWAPIQRPFQYFRAVERTLNDLMEFDHVIEVHADGSVTDAPPGVYAPTLYDGELDDKSWTMMNGYSGQDRYAGPIMHNSEYIGGRMEDDILAEPGYYVAVISSYSEDADGEDDEEGNVEGWAVAYKRN